MLKTIEITHRPIEVMGQMLTRTVRDVFGENDDGRLVRFVSREVVRDEYRPKIAVAQREP